MRYAAFISYRHVDPDRKWAKWLHTRLESYRIPKAIMKGRKASSRIGRVFRDEEELAASADLSHEIRTALQESQFLVVVCSPAAPASRWVNQEIKEFDALGRRNNILALLTSGEPDQSFPPALMELGIEPLAADVREGSRRATKEAELRILATLVGCRFDDLRQREQERRVRRAMLVTAVMSVVAVLFGIVSVIAVIQRNSARSRELAVNSGYVLNDDPELSVLLATEALRVQNTQEAEEALREGLVRFSLRAILKGHVGGLERVGFSADGKRLLTAGDDGIVRVWNMETDSLMLVLNAHKKPVTSAVFSPDGRLILTASGSAISNGENVARVWDASSGALLEQLEGHTGYITNAAFSHDGKSILTAGSDRTARVWDAASGRQKAVLTGHTAALTSAGFAVDDRSAFTTSLDGKAEKWDLAVANPVHSFEHVGEVYALALSPNGALAATTERGFADVESAANLQKWCQIPADDADHDVIGVAFSPDSKSIATAGTDGVAMVASLPSAPLGDGFCQAIRLVGHNGSINRVVFTPDGRNLITASDDHTARVWETRSGRLLAQLVGHGGPVRDAVVSSDGKYLATASADGTARIWQINLTLPRLTLPGSNAVAAPIGTKALTWTDASAAIRDTSNGHELAKLDGETGKISEAAFSPDTTQLLTASDDGTARIWDTATGKIVKILHRDATPLTHVAFSRSGNRAAVVSKDAVVRVWDIQKGSLVAQLRGHTAAVNSVMFSSDGRRLATASEDGTVRIWDAANGANLLVYRGHSGPVKRATFSANDTRVISASPGNGNVTTRAWNNEPVRIWNSRAGTDIFHLLGHTDVITDAILSPDGKLILTTSYDSTARIWDAESGVNISQLRGHTEEVDQAAFSPDSKFAVTTGGDCSLRVWDAHSGRSLLVIQGDRGCFQAAQFSADGTVLAQNVSGIKGYPAENYVDLFACEICVSTDRLLELARERVKRDLLPAEKARYLR
ncbi:MAG: TIR domain-containing protein [Silvibacterium sp.]